MSDCVRLRSVCSVTSPAASLVDRHAAVRDRSAIRWRRRRDLQPVFLQLRPVHFEQLDVDDDFRPRLVDRGEDARGRGDPLRRVLDRQRVGGGGRRDPPRVEHHAQQIHRFLQVGVAQVERPDDFFLVLAALGRRVGDDHDGLRRRRRERTCASRRRRRSSASSSVALRRSTVTGASRNAGSKIRLMLANRAMAVKTSRLLASRKVSDAGILTPCGRSRPGGGRSRARSISVCSSVLPSRATATFARSLLRVDRSSSSTSPLVGFSSAASFVLDQRLVELAGRREPAAAVEVILRRAQLGALERRAARRGRRACCRTALVYSTTARS